MLRNIPTPISIRIHPATRAYAKRSVKYAESKGLANAILVTGALIANHIASPQCVSNPDPLLHKFCDGGWSESNDVHKCILGAKRITAMITPGPTNSTYCRIEFHGPKGTMPHNLEFAFTEDGDLAGITSSLR